MSNRLLRYSSNRPFRRGFNVAIRSDNPLFAQEVDRTLRDLIQTGAVAIGRDDTLNESRQIFKRRRFHHLVVAEGSRIVGIVSDHDLLNHLGPFAGKLWAEQRVMQKL